jgi:hypothetical protein
LCDDFLDILFLCVCSSQFKDISVPNQDSSLWINSETKEIIVESTRVKTEPTFCEVDISVQDQEDDVKPNFENFSPIAQPDSEFQSDLVIETPIKSEQASFASYESDVEIPPFNHKLEVPDVRNCNCCTDCQQYKRQQHDRVGRGRLLRQRLRKSRRLNLYKTTSYTKKRELKKQAILLKAKLQQFLLKSDADYDKENNFAQIRRRPVLIGVYKHLKAIDVYSSLLVDLKEMASKRPVVAEATEVEVGAKKAKVEEPTIKTEPEKPALKKNPVKRENNEDKDYGKLRKELSIGSFHAFHVKIINWRFLIRSQVEE